MHFKISDNLEALRGSSANQDGLFRQTVEYAYRCSPFYRRRFDELGLKPSDFKSIESITRLPITSREDLQKDNWSFLSVERPRISEVVATTGTTGSPVFFALTGADLERLAENEKRSFAEMSVKPGDLVQVAVTLDNLFIAGLAYYTGLKRLGASAVRTGPQNPRRQMELISALGPEAIVAVPSFMLHMAREAEKGGISLRDLSVKKALLIGETIRNEDLTPNNLGRLVAETWPVETFSTYGITEASIAFYECSHHKGLHSHPDFVYAEVLDDDGKPAPPGRHGELAVTTFQVEAMPLIRYRTGDITFMLEGQCPCGKTGQRLGPVVGRKAQKLKLKGTTVYPGAIENALMKVKGVENFQIAAYSSEGGSDRVVVKVGSVDRSAEFLEEVKASIRSFARVTPEVDLTSPEKVEALLYEGGRRKKMTFVDLR